MMRDLMKNMTNEEMLDKIEYEGAEYFFLDYISLDSIKDEDLRKNVQILRLAWEDILFVVGELETESLHDD
jgi:nicotinate-nucleotide pyrophosphorylase